MLDFIANTPFTILMAYVLIAFIVFMLIAAARKNYREKVAAQNEYAALMAQDARKRSMANHPAGKGRVLSERHLDRPGYDWANGSL